MSFRKSLASDFSEGTKAGLIYMANWHRKENIWKFWFEIFQVLDVAPEEHSWKARNVDGYMIYWWN